jgi:hypothetical protein
VTDIKHIPLDDMTIEEEVEKFLHISSCAPKDFPFYDKRERSSDFIQINLKARILVWSLDDNCLVRESRDFSEHLSPESFVN